MSPSTVNLDNAFTIVITFLELQTEIIPKNCILAVRKTVFTVRRDRVWNFLHERLFTQQSHRILQGPPSGLRLFDDLQHVEDYFVGRVKVSWAPAVGSGELGAGW